MFMKRLEKLKEEKDDFRITKRYFEENDTVRSLVDYVGRNVDDFKSIVVEYEITYEESHGMPMKNPTFKFQFAFWKDPHGNKLNDFDLKWKENERFYKSFRSFDWRFISNTEISFQIVVTAINIYRTKWHTDLGYE